MTICMDKRAGNVQSFCFCCKSMNSIFGRILWNNLCIESLLMYVLLHFLFTCTPRSVGPSQESLLSPCASFYLQFLRMLDPRMILMESEGSMGFIEILVILYSNLYNCTIFMLKMIKNRTTKLGTWPCTIGNLALHHLLFNPFAPRSVWRTDLNCDVEGCGPSPVQTK
jgi:hypothetical protein